MKRLIASLLLALTVSSTTLAAPPPRASGATTDDWRRTTGLPNEDNVSLTLWLRLESNTGGSQNVFNMSDGTNFIQRVVVTATTLTLSTGSASLTTGTTLSTGVWYFVAATRSGTAYKTYLNGSTTADASNTSSETSGAMSQWVWMNSTSSGTVDCRCTMAAVKFWNALLTPEQLANEKYTYRPRTTANLYFWGPFPNTQTNLVDYSGNGNDGTDGGIDTSSENPPIGSW